MTINVQHTPTPWTVDETSYSDVDGHIKIRAADHAWVACAHVTDRRGEATANAAFIVLACNSYDELLAAAERIQRWAQEYPWTGLGDATGYDEGVGMLAELQAAITKAK